MPELTPASIPDFPVEVIRSAKRRKTISARFHGNTLQVRIPARLSRTQEQEAVAELVEKVARSRTSSTISDAHLAARAHALNAEVLQGQAKVSSIRWVDNQTRRWGSCSQLTGEIRISSRLKGVPVYVLDAVIVHELVHTFISTGHSAEFWQWADRVEKAERAKGFLEAWARMP